MDVILVMVKDDGSSREFKIDRESTVIGRDEAARLRIPLSAVSRRHCEIILDADDELLVRDLGSSNGTYLNGKKVRQAELSPGDLLTVGPVVFVVRISGHPKDIDAKDCYMAGVVGGDDEEDDDDLPPPAPKGNSAPTTSMNPAPRKNSKDDLSDLLKDLDLGDDDDDEPPTKKR